MTDGSEYLLLVQELRTTIDDKIGARSTEGGGLMNSNYCTKTWIDSGFGMPTHGLLAEAVGATVRPRAISGVSPSGLPAWSPPGC